MNAASQRIQELVTPNNLAKIGTGGASLLIADTFYKFGAFTPECLAFLATWGVLYGILPKSLKRDR